MTKELSEVGEEPLFNVFTKILAEINDEALVIKDRRYIEAKNKDINLVVEAIRKHAQPKSRQSPSPLNRRSRSDL